MDAHAADMILRVIATIWACAFVADGFSSSTRYHRKGMKLHHAKQETHDAIAQLLIACLVNGPRAIEPERVHFDVALSDLPLTYGFGDRPRCNLRRTPDIVAHDAAKNELLVIEVTVVPDGALPKYCERKQLKYADLACTPADAARPRVPPPVVVAIGIGGTVPDSTRHALSVALLLSDKDSERLAAEAAVIATARPDAPAARAEARAATKAARPRRPKGAARVSRRERERERERERREREEQ